MSARVTITFKTYSGGTRLASCPSSEKLPYSRGIHQMRAARAYEICCDFLFKIFTYLALIITVHVIRRFCFYSLGTTIQMISCRARLVTMDETRLYHHDPETKQQSMEWRHSGSPRPKKFRVPGHTQHTTYAQPWCYLYSLSGMSDKDDDDWRDGQHHYQ